MSEQSPKEETVLKLHKQFGSIKTEAPPPSCSQVVAIVMDLMTDLQIIQDLLDASSRRGVAVYAVLEVSGVPHFLDMCSRLQVNATHLRVRKHRRGGREGGHV